MNNFKYEKIVDNLKSQPDIFWAEQDFYIKSEQTFKMQMEEIFKWVSFNLLFDTFEYIFWLHLIQKDIFNILKVRYFTGL